MIIHCKGIQKNHRFEKCSFLHDGEWNDDVLIEHEKYHRSLEDKNHFWLGFDVSRSFGTYSGRDGKRF